MEQRDRPLTHDSNTLAQHLKDNTAFRTALIGKPRFEPFSSPQSMESSLAMPEPGALI